MAAAERQLTGAPDDGSTGPRRAGLSATVLESYGLLWLGTVLAAVVALPIATHVRGALGLRLAPVRAGDMQMAALIAANNVRVAAVPLLFATLRVGDARRWLLAVGDVVVGATLAVNVALGGLALGAYRLRLVAYLPQWPLEWGALAVALAAWRRARRGRRDVCELVLLGIGAGMLLCLAALLETYAVPQR